MKYYIYTDGATSNNGRANAKGGWAAILVLIYVIVILINGTVLGNEMDGGIVKRNL